MFGSLARTRARTRAHFPCCEQHADAGVSKVLIGNKSDMVGKIAVTDAEGRALADKYGIPFFLASAKTNLNVTEVCGVPCLVCSRRPWRSVGCQAPSVAKDGEPPVFQVVVCL